MKFKCRSHAASVGRRGSRVQYAPAPQGRYAYSAAGEPPHRPGARVDTGPHKTEAKAEPDWQRDAELLEAWRRGDMNAGRRLHQRHVGAVTRFFASKVAEGHEDLVQVTFLRLIEGRDRVRTGIVIRAFILGIARNVLHEHLRRRSGPSRGEPRLDEMPSPTPSPVALIDRGHHERRLREGLERLPEIHRQILELFYWQGLNAGEIAEVMGISHSAMRSRLVKARGLLRAAMAERDAKKPWTPRG